MKLSAGLLVLLFLASQSKGFSAEDTTKIDNELVRVLVVESAARAKSQLHEHKVNRVMIYLDSGKMTLTDSAGGVEELNFKKDEALWSPMTKRPHVSENVSGHAVKIVEIEVKSLPRQKLAASELDWVKVDPRRYKVELENDQVRVVRVKYGPHEKGVFHEHPYNLVVAYLSDGQMKVSPQGGEPVTVSYKRGDVKFGRASKHVEENLSDAPLEIVVVELK
jgi:quercetin dioxygenase-like cupin family protein